MPFCGNCKRSFWNLAATLPSSPDRNGSQSTTKITTLTYCSTTDDYDGWSASPPQQKDGTVLSELTGWGRSVEVLWMDPWDLSQNVFSNQGVKRIAITVVHNNVPVASLIAFRTIVAPSLGE